jgi:hypothetical protein
MSRQQRKRARAEALARAQFRLAASSARLVRERPDIFPRGRGKVLRWHWRAGWKLRGKPAPPGAK